MELSPSSIAEAFEWVDGEHPDGAGVDQVGQQNTNTRKLTEEMLDGVFLRARGIDSLTAGSRAPAARDGVTSTGRLTDAMRDGFFLRAWELLHRK
jgi:hypothetical protein